MKVLVTGVGVQLGHDVMNELKKRGHEAVGTDVQGACDLTLDITDAAAVAETLRQIRPDALIPVPIHSSRKRARGYNQAQLIAEALSEHTGIPVNGVLIGRCKRTKPLKNLTGRERQNNLKKAFKILQNDVKLDTIVIIDDVYTTGSTVDAMTQVLQSAGISKVYVLTLTIGRGI